MEQAVHLKDTVEKLDHALARLQEIQSTLRGHSPLPGIADHDITRSLQTLKVPQLRRFDELDVDQSVNWRRWSTPASSTHDALSEAITTSKFAKKTVDMVKVQKIQAAKSSNTSSNSQAKVSVLHPFNRVNLLQPDMAAPDDGNSKPRSLSKENRKTHYQSKLDLKEATKLQTKGGFRSVEKHGESRDKPSSSLHLGRSDRRVSFARVAPEEHVVSSNIIQVRNLLNGEEAANDPHSCGCQHDAFNCNTLIHDAPDHSMHQHDPINRNQQAASFVKRSSLSMRTLMQMEDKEKALSRPAFTQDRDNDIDSPSSPMASKSLCVQLEEIKSSRKKSWTFSQGKASDNVVVMFPNPTYDESTPPTSTPPDIKPTIDSTIPKASLHAGVSTFPSTSVVNKVPSDGKARFQKREKIVRLSPCSTTSNAQKPKLQPAPTSDIAKASKNVSLRKQKWKCTLTHPPSPTLIRRLPEAHEMKEIKHYGAAFTITPPSGSVGRSQNKTMGDEEDRQTLANLDHDDDSDSKTREKSWSFGSPFVVKNNPSTSDARRSSLGPPGGGHSFSFLSKHFHAWKLALKQDK